MKWNVIKLDTATKHSDLLKALTDGGHTRITHTTKENSSENLVIIGDVYKKDLAKLATEIGEQKGATGTIFIVDQIKEGIDKGVYKQRAAYLARQTGRTVLFMEEGSKCLTRSDGDNIAFVSTNNSSDTTSNKKKNTFLKATPPKGDCPAMVEDHGNLFTIAHHHLLYRSLNRMIYPSVRVTSSNPKTVIIGNGRNNEEQKKPPVTPVTPVGTLKR